MPPCKVGAGAAGTSEEEDAGRYFSDPVADAEEESQEVVDGFFDEAARQFDSDRLRRLYEGRKKEAATAEAGRNNW
jgi:hypothetical protein